MIVNVLFYRHARSASDANFYPSLISCERPRGEGNEMRYGNVERDGHVYDSYDYNRKLFTHYSIVRLTRKDKMAQLSCIFFFKRAARERRFTSLLISLIYFQPAEIRVCACACVCLCVLRAWKQISIKFIRVIDDSGLFVINVGVSRVTWSSSRAGDRRKKYVGNRNTAID